MVARTGHQSGSGRRDRVIEQFSKYQAARGFSDRTIKRRALTLRQVEKLLAPAALADASGDDLFAFIASKPSARTRHAYRSDLRVFYSWALKRGYVTTDPTILLDSIKVPKSLPRPFNGDLSVLLQIGPPRTRLMIALGLYAGLRCAEIARLDASDIFTHTKPPYIAVRDGKGRKDRIVEMHPRIALELDGLPTSGPLFINQRTGRTVTPATVGRNIKNQLTRAGLTGVPHQLRHTFGTELARTAAGDLQLVARAMGHESMDTTRGYAQFSDERSARAISAMFGGDAA